MQAYNEPIEDVKRFEQMVNGQTEYYFDVESIENIFDYYAENDDIEKAERVLNLGCKLHPNSIPLLLKKTFIFMEKDEDEKAIHLLEGILKLENTNIDLYFYLGWAYFKIEKDEKAIEYFKQGLALSYEDEEEELTLDIAFTLNQMEHYKYAIEILEERYEKFPDNEDILFELAYAYDKLNLLEKSHTAYRKILDINPFSENSWNNLGILYFKNNEFDRAIKAYDYALAINPSNAEALFNKANSLINMGEVLKAFDCYIDYVSYGYDDVMAYHYIADCLEQMKLYDLSMRFFDLTVKTKPDYLPAWLDYISILIDNNEGKKALEKTSEALLSTGLFPEFIYLRARAYILAKDYKSALVWIGRCVELEPENIRNIAEWLQVKKELQPQKKSLTFLNEWYELFPDSAALKYASAAIAMLELKNFKLAGKYLEEALIKSPDIFEDFVDYFSIPEEYIFENKILNKIILKYIEFE